MHNVRSWARLAVRLYILFFSPQSAQHELYTYLGSNSPFQTAGRTGRMAQLSPDNRNALSQNDSANALVSSLTHLLFLPCAF
ncbi:hypothetical protein BT63DRAFT_430014 [Microthyrium microscopicum]|uniref:Secreted protein n=1 Tax=Microthyrium microscopicum TaxID=703497 RepID=A0A6A6TX37_9PEZI|nr:hypothetical protein BT63DRAFT_430014 [Microthyrium microscopicum]